jgi:hypothetical protein
MSLGYKQHFDIMEQFSHMQEPEDNSDDWNSGWGKFSEKEEATGQQVEEHSPPSIRLRGDYVYANQQEVKLEPVKKVVKTKDDTMAREVEALRALIKQQEDARVAREQARNMQLLPTLSVSDSWSDWGPRTVTQQEENSEPTKEFVVEKVVEVETNDNPMVRAMELSHATIEQRADARMTREQEVDLQLRGDFLHIPLDYDVWSNRGPHIQQEEMPGPVKEVVFEEGEEVEKKDDGMAKEVEALRAMIKQREEERIAREDATIVAEIARKQREEREAEYLDAYDTADLYSRHPADLILSVSGMTTTMRAVLEAHHLEIALELGRKMTRDDDQCLANAFSVL